MSFTFDSAGSLMRLKNLLLAYRLKRNTLLLCDISRTVVFGEIALEFERLC